MSTLMREVNARTGLAGANQMELLLFDVGTSEVFGINVFKVREVMKMPAMTRVPEADARIEGMANIRGTTVPVIDLRKTLALATSLVEETEAHSGDKLIITEYNASLQGFHVAGVDRILRISWSQIKTPPTLVRDNAKGAVTAVTTLEDGRMVLILDVEKILSEMCPRPEEEIYGGVKPQPTIQGKTVLFADDSGVARTQIRKTLERLGIQYIQTTNGQEAWDTLRHLTSKAEAEGRTIKDEIQLVLSDIEMPDMDGFTLTRHIRADVRMASLPVILHSSLTGSCNAAKGQSCGATDYVVKFDPLVLGQILLQHLDSRR